LKTPPREVHKLFAAVPRPEGTAMKMGEWATESPVEVRPGGTRSFIIRENVMDSWSGKIVRSILSPCLALNGVTSVRRDDRGPPAVQVAAPALERLARARTFLPL